MPTHVLVAIDDAEQSTAALEYALDTHADTRLTALHVIDPRDIYTATGRDPDAVTNYKRIRANRERRADELLERARERAAERDIELETAFRIGGAAKTIVAYAADNEIDHIVVGSHGRTGASRVLLGSVAETVARRSPIPVTVVR